MKKIDNENKNNSKDIQPKQKTSPIDLYTHNLEGPEVGQFCESLDPLSGFDIVGEEIESGIFNAGCDG